MVARRSAGRCFWMPTDVVQWRSCPVPSSTGAAHETLARAKTLIYSTPTWTVGSDEKQGKPHSAARSGIWCSSAVRWRSRCASDPLRRLVNRQTVYEGGRQHAEESVGDAGLVQWHSWPTRRTPVIGHDGINLLPTNVENSDIAGVPRAERVKVVATACAGGHSSRSRTCGERPHITGRGGDTRASTKILSISREAVEGKRLWCDVRSGKQVLSAVTAAPP